MKSKLKCECCSEFMQGDLNNNVWCDNSQCLLYGKCYSFDFIYGRAQDRAVGKPMQEKERMMQGWAGNPENREVPDPHSDPRPELRVGVCVTWVDGSGNNWSGIVDSVLENHVVVQGFSLVKSIVSIDRKYGYVKDSNNWLVCVRNRLPMSWSLIKCSDSIFPYREKGYELIYDGMEWDELKPLFESELERTKWRKHD